MTNFKFLFIPLLAVSLFSSLQAEVLLPKNMPLEQVAPASKDFFWDLHDVVVVRGTYDKMFAYLGALHNVAAAGIITLGQKVTLWFTGYRGSYLEALAQIKTLPTTVSGDAYMQIFENCGAYQLASLTEKIANAYRPNQPVIDRIMQLKDLGHRHYIASNIGVKALPALVNKITTSYNNPIFSTLTSGLIVNYASAAAINTASVIGDNTYKVTNSYKPNDSYFNELKESYCNDSNRVAIFVDDNLKNVEAAVRNGFVGIWYKKGSATAITEFYADLAALGCSPENKKTQ